MDGLCLDPLHLLQDAHRIIICFAPEHSGSDHHVIVCILVLGSHLRTFVFHLLLRLEKIRRDRSVLVHKFIIAVKFTGILFKSGQQRDHVCIDRLAQAVVLRKAEELVICILAGRRVVIRHIDHRTRSRLMAVLDRRNDLLCISAPCGEDTHGIL